LKGEIFMLVNLKMFYKTITNKVLEIESSLRGKTGEEKRAAAVAYLSDLIDIPCVPNIIEKPIKKWAIGQIVDLIVEKLNWLGDWNFTDTTLSDDQTEKLAAVAEAPIRIMSSALAVLPSSATIDERLEALYKAYNTEPMPLASGSAPIDAQPEPKPTPPQVANVWDRAISFVLKWEGGYVNNPADKGGETNMGITQGTLANAIAQGLIIVGEGVDTGGRCIKTVSVKDLSLDNVKVIYRANYWERYGWGNITWPGCLILLDATVHHGGGGMARLAQRAANILGWNLVEDGKFGPKTLEAVTKLSEAQSVNFAEEYLRQRKKFFDDIIAKDDSQKVFLKGWYKRLQGLAAECGVKNPV
jgi:lysozyme family protein